MAVETIVDHIIYDAEGGTAQADGQLTAHTHGYYVGGTVKPLILSAGPDFTPDLRRTLHEYVSRIVLREGARYVGWWVDGDSGALYVDGTDWIEDQDLAARVARERRELAFYDIANTRDIRLVYVEGE